jgi:hypothetical protein
MISPQEIIQDRDECLKKLEEMVDTHLKAHFSKFNHNKECRVDVLKYGLNDEIVGILMNRYAMGGWKAEYKAGCDDRPCAEPYRYILFSIPTK